MLIDFSIRNFRSIKDPVSLDMGFSQNAPKNHKNGDALFFTPVSIKQKIVCRIIPLLVIFGGNATGKSNLLMGLRTLKRILSKDRNSVEEPFPFEPFLLSNMDDKPTEYSIVIERNSKVYRYTISLDSNRVYDERLYESIYNNETRKIVEKLIFDVSSGFYDVSYKSENQIDFKKVYETECNFKSPLLSKIAIKYNGILAEQINDVFYFIKDELDVYEGNKIHKSLAVNKASSTDEDLAETMKKISRLLSKMDIDVEDIILDRHLSTVNRTDKVNFSEFEGRLISMKPMSDGKMDITADSFKSIHRKEDGNTVEFDFEKQESLGTKTLFSLLGIVIEAIKNGSTLVIDEVDRSLHTDLLNIIFKMFKSKNLNKKGAQLICTSHNPCVLLLLNKSEAAFTDKERGATKIKYLSDMDIKNENNFLKNYLSGRFGGRPMTISDIDLEDF